MTFKAGTPMTPEQLEAAIAQSEADDKTPETKTPKPETGEENDTRESLSGSV